MPEESLCQERPASIPLRNDSYAKVGLWVTGPRDGGNCSSKPCSFGRGRSGLRFFSISEYLVENIA